MRFKTLRLEALKPEFHQEFEKISEILGDLPETESERQEQIYAPVSEGEKYYNMLIITRLASLLQLICRENADSYTVMGSIQRNLCFLDRLFQDFQNIVRIMDMMVNTDPLFLELENAKMKTDIKGSQIVGILVLQMNGADKMKRRSQKIVAWENTIKEFFNFPESVLKAAQKATSK